MRSTPTIETYTRCGLPDRDAARIRFRVAAASPLVLVAQCTMTVVPSTGGINSFACAQVAAQKRDALGCLPRPPRQHAHVAACRLQPAGDTPAEAACTSGDQDWRHHQQHLTRRGYPGQHMLGLRYSICHRYDESSWEYVTVDSALAAFAWACVDGGSSDA